MNRILTLAKYDFLQRVRSYQFLIISAASLAFAYILIPAPDDRYSTVRIGDYLGNYNSAWIAYVTAIMASTFISLLGYYLVNNSIRTDHHNKVGQIVAATRIENFHYLLAKFLGNFLVLLSVLGIIFLVSILLFFLYGQGYPFEIGQFLAAYLLVPVPAIAFIAALAILLEVIFKERSVLQNVVYFFLFAFMTVQSQELGLSFDPFGAGMPTKAMEQQLLEQVPDIQDPFLNIGFIIGQEPLQNRFNYKGMPFSFTFLLIRLFWLAAGIFIVFMSSRFFHRFELNERLASARKKAKKMLKVEENGQQELDLGQLPKLSRSPGILPVFKAELLMMLRKGKKWLWFLNLTGIILLFALPIDIAHTMVLPILWFLQVHRWADLVSKEKSHQMHYFIFSSYKPVQRLLSAQWLAAYAIAVTLALPLILRYALTGDLLLVATILTGALFIIALSSFLGIVTEGKRLFEILFFFITYLNVNGAPFTDYFGAINQSASYLTLLAGITLALVALSFLFRQWELKRI